MDKNKLQSFVLYASVLLWGRCASISPDIVMETQYEYNSAIANTNNEQMLLNIVRAKYHDSLNFLEIVSIAENRKFTTRVGPSGSKIGFDQNAGHAELGLVAYGEDSQNPIITFSLFRGEQSTKCMILPVPLPAVLGLAQAGWDINLVFN
ncbi:MAG: hypothetical protein LBC30_01735 [Puniceicoccales bacterium]|jgi:hypothetical protein|nr:hypothetical protein [Puniceicoccales bacterium]